MIRCSFDLYEGFDLKSSLGAVKYCHDFIRYHYSVVKALHILLIDYSRLDYRCFGFSEESKIPSWSVHSSAFP